jgi:hypothetical protein
MISITQLQRQALNSFIVDIILGKGHYYKNHNVKNQKEHQKICKPSQRRKWLLS